MPVSVSAAEEANPRLIRVTLTGDSLRSMEEPEPAASVRLLIPSTPHEALIIPEWSGNEFLLPSGDRPVIRTFTPVHLDRSEGSIDLEIVRHDGGAVSEWADAASVGDPAALSGPGRGYQVDAGAHRLLIFGDETAVPAVRQLLESIQHRDLQVGCTIHLESASPTTRSDLPDLPATDITWHDHDPELTPMSGVVATAESIKTVGPDTRVWAAGEAAAMQALRKHFQRVLEVPREHTTIRGYWKQRR